MAKILWGHKDGGPESKVWAWGVESKRFGSVILLKFGRGSREAYHSHAFDCISWVLSGALFEWLGHGTTGNYYPASRHPVRTYRDTFHKVEGLKEATWVLTFRGPWVDEWREETADGPRTLTHGRKEVVR